MGSNADYTHPGKPEHVMRIYRAHLLGCKRKWGSARGLIHYRALIQTYLAAKRTVLSERYQGTDAG